jgi:hypothetical protein
MDAKEIKEILKSHGEFHDEAIKTFEKVSNVILKMSEVNSQLTEQVTALQEELFKLKQSTLYANRGN